MDTVPCYRGGRCGSRTHRTNSKAFYECLRLMSKEEAQKPPKQAFALVSNKDSDLNSLEFDGPGIFTNSKYGPLYITRSYDGGFDVRFKETVDMGAMLVAMEYISDTSELEDDLYESAPLQHSDVLTFFNEYYDGAMFPIEGETECLDDGVYSIDFDVHCDPGTDTLAGVVERVGRSITKIREGTPEDFGSKYNAPKIYQW